MTFSVTPEIYQIIDSQILFNLKREIRIPFTSEGFNSSNNIQIEASLDPNLLPKLAEHGTDINQVGNYLQKLSQEQPENPLLSTYSWYGLQVKQQQENREIGYRTLWLYLQPSLITQDGISSENITQAMNDLAKEWTNNNFSENPEEDITQSLEQITHVFEDFTENMSEMTQKIISEAVEEINNTIENLTQELSEIIDEVPAYDSIFSATMNFFTRENWQFTQVEEDSVLYMDFPGKNGIFTCYAKARETQQQLIFYSHCPIIVPESKLLSIAEFITRANYNMVIGNFELDFNEGEIRYKTSIDIEDMQLSYNCIKNLIYTNVNIIDKYLPGIISLINDDVLPAFAINQIEQISNTSPSSSEPEQNLVIISDDNELELIENSSPQIELDSVEHILSILIPEEITEFQQISEMVAPYQQKKVAVMTEKLQSRIMARLGDSSSEIFTRASTFFREVKLPAKNLKLIQRYSGLGLKTKLLLQNFQSWSEQNEELPVNSQVTTALVELDRLFWQINDHLQELPTEKFLGRKEVELLVELEDFREKINFYDKIFKSIDGN